MKLTDFTKSFTSLELTTLAIFIIYILFPFRTPFFLAGTVNTPLGLIVILIVTLYLFFYTNPILGIVYIFVAYELLRRSALVKPKADNYMIEYTPSEVKREREMIKMNPVQHISLEEEVVSAMAPSQKFNLTPVQLLSNDFQPVSSKLDGASLL